jgi:two-component system, LytTR family, sensor kinase
MRTVSPVNLGELLNLVGLSTGVALYAMLLAMVLRARGRVGAAAAFDPLLLLTSALGLLWNLCALAGYVLPKFSVTEPLPLITAIGFGALGLLPAVVVHSVLRGGNSRGGWTKQAIGAIAYSVSAVAATMHLAAAIRGAVVPSAEGMRLLTYTFVALVLPLAAVTRGQPGSRRALWVTALAVFAVSALHLSQLHSANPSWSVELLGHHAALPLALAILYQDYPFAFADLFLKRALVLLALVSIAFVAVATAGDRSAAFAEFIERDPRLFALLVTLWVLTALAYPWLRAATAWFVDSILLHRPDYRAMRASLSGTLQTVDEVPAVLAALAEMIRPSLSSPSVTWQRLDEGDAQDRSGRLVATDKNGVTRVMVPTAESPRYVIALAPLTGGRRLLSDEVATLEASVLIAARRIDAIRVTQERHDREIREREMERLATEAELRALRAQVNPHFLFNALTTIGYLIQTAPPRALETLLRLTSLLRGVLRSEGEFTTLGRELEIIEAYLDIERERFEQRLRVSIDVPARLRSVRLPALVLQPLVENAVKHGIAPMASGGEVVIRARVDLSPRGVRQLTVTIRDSGAGVAPEQLHRRREQGVGLRNVERRLRGQYGSDASLSIDSVPGRGTTVDVRLPVTATAAQPAPNKVATA